MKKKNGTFETSREIKNRKSPTALANDTPSVAATSSAYEPKYANGTVKRREYLRSEYESRRSVDARPQVRPSCTASERHRMKYADRA